MKKLFFVALGVVAVFAVACDYVAVSVTTKVLPDIPAGELYSAQVVAAGGSETGYAFSIIDGALPDGLVLNPSTGDITGTPTADTGRYRFTVQAEDTGAPEQYTTKDSVKYTVHIFDTGIEPDSYEAMADFDKNTSNSISVNGAAQIHTRHHRFDSDFIKLDLSDMEEGTIIKIETYPVDGQASSDTFLYIYNSSMNTVIGNDDQGEGKFSRIISGGFNSAVYYISVSGWSGAYKIDVKTVTYEADVYEGDDTIAETSTVVQPGDPAQVHTFHLDKEEDYIKLECPDAEAGELIKIETYWDQSKYYGNYMKMKLVDSNGTQVQAAARGQYVGCIMIWEYTPGDFYIVVSPEYDGTSSYRIDVANVPLQDEYEVLNDDKIETTTNTIVPGAPIQYHTFHNEDGDYYSYDYEPDYMILDCRDLAPGTKLKIETHLWKTLTDTAIRLFNATDQYEGDAIYDGDGGVWSYSRIDWVCETPGFYYIEVKQANYHVGDYGIDVVIVE